MVKSKLLICKEFKIQPSEIDRMVYFEYEYMLEDIKEYQKEKQTQAEAQEKEHQQMQQNMRNPMGGFKMPSLPKFNPSSFKI